MNSINNSISISCNEWSDRRVWSMGFLLFSIYFITSTTVSFFSPCGQWVTTVWGVPFWDSCDPGGPYVGSALHFSIEEKLPFVGHPGISLQVLIWLTAQFTYSISRFLGSQQNFVTFSASHLYLIFWLSSIVCTLMHILSFYLFYRLSLKLLGKVKDAFIATLTYATSFPVLFFSARVSIEPFMMVVIFGSFILLWKSRECMATNKLIQMLVFSGLLGCLSGIGLVTKIQLLGPLCFLMPIFVAIPDSKVAIFSRFQIYQRAISFGTALIASLSVASFCAMKINISQFIGFWTQYSPTRDLDMTAGRFFLIHLGPFVPTKFRSQLVDQGTVYVLSEYFLFSGSLAGFYYFFRSATSEARYRLLSLALYSLCIAPIVIFRAQFHYQFMWISLFSIGFGYFFANHALQNFNQKFRRRMTLFIPLLIHAVSFLFIANAKVNDMTEFRRRYMPFERALSLTESGRKVGIVVTFDSSHYASEELWKTHGIYPAYVSPTLPVMQAFTRQFHVVSLENKDDFDFSTLFDKNVEWVLDLRFGDPILRRHK